MKNICYYGCDRPANHYFQSTKKHCCSSHYKKCPAQRKLMESHMRQVHKNNPDLGIKISKGLNNMNKQSFTDMRDKWYKMMYINPSSEELLDRNKRNSESNKLATPIKIKKYKQWIKSLTPTEYKQWRDNTVAWQKDGDKKKKATTKMLKTRTNNGTYNKHIGMKKYKNTDILFQGSYEYNYLKSLEREHGIQWVKNKVKRGPTIKYIDPNDDNQHLYFSDFMVDGVVIEVKSSWTWNGEGKNKPLEQKNVAKLDETSRHFDTVLVLDGKSIKW